MQHFCSFLNSTLSLASVDVDSPESTLTRTSGSLSDVSKTRTFDNRSSPEKPSLTKQGHLQEHQSKGARSSPASLSGSLTDIPVLLVNGAPQPELTFHSNGTETDLKTSVRASKSKPSSPSSELVPFVVYHILLTTV